MKKDGMLDVTVETHDGAEVCKVVETFLLDKISEKHDTSSTGLFHDDGLSLCKNKSDIRLKNNKKELKKNIQGVWFRNSARI